MKPFKIAMEKGDGLELYGQGETLVEAMQNLVRAVDEYGDDLDKREMIVQCADLLNCMPHPCPDPKMLRALVEAGPRCPCGDMTVNDCAGECGR